MPAFWPTQQSISRSLVFVQSDFDGMYAIQVSLELVTYFRQTVLDSEFAVAVAGNGTNFLQPP